MTRVLIVDDALDLGRLLKAAVSTLDPAISTAVVPSAEEALLDAGRNPPDLLVVDFLLPGMSGFELITKIRTRLSALKVIFITGQKDLSLQAKAEALGVDAFFRKPMDMTAFLDAVSSCLNLAPVMVDLPGQVEPGKPATPSGTAAELLVRAHKDMDARAILLINSAGRLVAQAGDSPAISQVLQVYELVWETLASGNRISRAIGSTYTGHLLTFTHAQYDLLVSKAGDHALVIILEPASLANRKKQILERCLELQGKLAVLYPQVEARKTEPNPVSPAATPAQGGVPPTSEPSTEEDVSNLQALEALFDQAGLTKANGDTYWETLAANQPARPDQPDLLTYDQAQKLGLAPSLDLEAPEN